MFLHLGFPKTATTYQQLEIFPKLKEVKYFPILTKKKYEKIIWEIVSKDLTRERCQNIREKLLQSSQEEKILLSQEVFSTGFFWVFPKGEAQRCQALYNFRKIFYDFHVRLLICIRSQVEIIKSFYMLYLHKCGTKDLIGFLNQSSCVDPVDVEKSFYNLFKYSNYLDLSTDIFGRENVFIYVFEKLITDPQEYLNRMINFFEERNYPKIDTKVHNKGYNKIQVRLSRVLNRFFKSYQNPDGLIPIVTIPMFGELSPRRLLQSRWFPGFFSKKYILPVHISNQLREAYRADNLYINQKYGLNLPDSYF
jgi:hypothetical protein